MRSGSLLGLSMLLTLAAACGDDDGAGDSGDGGGGEAGSHAAGSHADAGPLVWTPKDAGQSLPPIEVPPPSGGTGGSSNAMCAKTRDPLPAVVLPRCAASTRDCIEGCAAEADPDACRDACISADVTPPETTYGLACDSCIYLQLFACIDAAGCHDGVAELFCCLEAKCPEGSPEGCGEQQCGNELMAAITCGYNADMTCLAFTSGLSGQCFAAGDDADGGA